MKNGNFIFNLSPEGGKSSPRLCLSDGELIDFNFFLPAPDGYVGGVVTPDNFRTLDCGLVFYQSPSDTIYYLNENGYVTGGLVLDYRDKKVPSEAKIDFVSAREKKLLDNSFILYNTPVMLGNGMMFSTIVEGHQQYILLFDPSKGSCYVGKCDTIGSIYDVLEMSTSDDDGRIICYLDVEDLEQSKEFDSLPDSVRFASEGKDGYMLVLYSFCQD